MIVSLLDGCKILVYICKLYFPKCPGYYFPIYMLTMYNKLQTKTIFLKVSSVPYDVVKKILNNSSVVLNSLNDINNTIIISNYYSNKFSGFVEVVSESSSVKRIVFSTKSLFVEQGVVVVSDTLNFNLRSNTLNIQFRDFEKTIFVSELDLSLINSSYELNNKAIDTLIKNYFKIPKLINVGDILSVQVKKYAPQFYYSNFNLNSFKYVYFKCSGLRCKTHNSSSGLCVVGETTFKHLPNIQSFIPHSCYYYKIGGFGSYSNSYPSGLENYGDMLEKLIKPFVASKTTKLPLHAAFLIEGSRGLGKRQLVSSLAKKFGVHEYEVTSNDVNGTTYAQTEARISATFFKAKLCAPCFLIIDSFENFCKNNEGQYDQRIVTFFKSQLEKLFTNNAFPLILICISNNKDVIPVELKQCFLHAFRINAPDLQQKAAMLSWVLQLQNMETNNIDCEELVKRMHGFVLADLQAFVYFSKWNYRNFESVIDLMQLRYNQSLGTPKIPNVQWNDIGGLPEIEQEIMHTINLPLKYPKLLRGTGLKRSGILLYGPPGTGKTLVAKAVANECKLCFLSVKGPELLNMYVGQSEKNIREVFQRAKEASPCIIFFDELDSLAPNRGTSGDSGGVMDRVVSQLLAEMDGLEQTTNIFIIGATNRPDLIDQSLLRPGRFDKLLYVGPSIDVDSKISVFKALTKKFNLDGAVDLKQISLMCPQYITGADLYSLCSSAWLSATQRILEKEEVYHMSHQDVIVTMKDFEESLKDLKSSIKYEDLMYFNKLRKQFEVTSD